MKIDTQNTTDYSGMTALHIASKVGEMMRYCTDPVLTDDTVSMK